MLALLGSASPAASLASPEAPLPVMADISDAVWRLTTRDRRLRPLSFFLDEDDEASLLPPVSDELGDGSLCVSDKDRFMIEEGSDRTNTTLVGI